MAQCLLTETTGIVHTTVLEADDVKAMKQANDAVIFYHKKGSFAGRSYGNGEGEVRLRSKSAGVFQGELEYSIKVPSGITAYDTYPRTDESSAYKLDELDAHFGTYATGFDAHWQTVLAIIKVGDELSLEWTRSNTSPWMQEKGITVDYIDVVIKRPAKNGRGKRRRFVIRMGESVTSTLSWTRLVRTESDRNTWHN